MEHDRRRVLQVLQACIRCMVSGPNIFDAYWRCDNVACIKKRRPKEGEEGLDSRGNSVFHRSSYLLGNCSIPSFVGRNDSASNCNAAANNPAGLIFSLLSFIILAACMIASEIMNGL